MELKPFLFLPGASATAATGLGGKAENLWRLAQCRVDVPRWIALDAACLAQVTAGAPDAAAAIRTFAFPPEWPATLNEALDQAGITAAFLAVRSSAAGEDGDQHSFAGQLDSCLFVRRDRLTEAIRQVWLSAFGERAAAYRRQNRLTDQPIRVAVIIQEMVEADVSGVAFDVDLATGSRRGTTISAVYGLGETPKTVTCAVAGAQQAAQLTRAAGKSPSKIRRSSSRRRRPAAPNWPTSRPTCVNYRPSTTKPLNESPPRCGSFPPHSADRRMSNGP